jgi:cyclophilin family peptidyl-prolyl cis-trans isomerase
MPPLPRLLLLATLFGAGAATAAPAAAPTTPAAATTASAPAPASTSAASRKDQDVVFETAEGQFTIRLYPADAPKTVANFVKLVSQGYYDSLTFHRVVPGFVLQGGDPNSRDDNPFNDGQGGPGYTVPAEIKRKHEQGAVAMARQPDVVNPARASNGSQFYIALAELPQLDGAYTVFGKVVAGWDTIERLVALAARTDIARVGNNANPGKLAMIRHARLVPRAPAAAGAPTATGAPPKR